MSVSEHGPSRLREPGAESDNRQSLLRRECPTCGKLVTVRLDGHLRAHGPRNKRCAGNLRYHGTSEGLSIKPGGFFAQRLESLASPPTGWQ